jgi:Asp-tRNA(Asn)/Glu-tRNA(Gln) amidotransferase A subunit family amidase
MPDPTPVRTFTASDYREHLAGGREDVVAFYQRHLDGAQAADRTLHAFANLDVRVVRLQAEHLVRQRQLPEPLPPLYGVPVAVKDVIDTIDFPTEFGSPIHEGRYAVSDATVVRRLRDAGAVIYGKTACSEFAAARPGRTRNPHDLERTPGGSSGGSAAAVAAGIVPVALGTQTNGSVIRPASCCGVFGYTPSAGLLPRTGVFERSPSLERLGLFARSIEDLAGVAEILSGDDGHDDLARGIAPRRLLAVSGSEPPLPPKFCFVKTPWWSRLDDEARAACEEFLEVMQGVVVSAELPPVVEQAVQWHRTVEDAELAFALQRELHHHAGRLSEELRQRVQAGMAIPALDYLAARDRMPHVRCAFDDYFEHYDAILAPAALGAAPLAVEGCGDPILQTVWSFAGLPSLNLPLLTLSDGLPLGVQAVGSHGNDARLLRAARWLTGEVANRSGT